jgi:SAM-dependent methyltransferase
VWGHWPMVEDMTSEVGDAYSCRAAEYAEYFGSMEGVHPSDRQLVTTWADQITGLVIDAGCGPGHWTNYLAERGVAVSGIDLVPEFITYARATYPSVPFHLGSVDELNAEVGTVCGVLAWYSLIHCEPDVIQAPLTEFARVLRPGSDLLLGFFQGPTVEKFEHTVVAAYQWPVDELCDTLRPVGFDVIETHTRIGPGHRPHGAILARRRASL